MYSLLLMTALAGTPDATGFGWRSGGCYGSCTGYSSCYGCTGYSSCNGCCGGYVASYGCCGGYSCSGCTGYSRGGFLGCGILSRLCGRRSSCHGCYGSSCYGSCYGSGYGSGCYGSCYGSGLNSGCWGSCYGSGAGYGCGGGCIGAAPVMDGVVVPTPAIPPAGATPAPAPAPKTSSNAADESAPARLTVELPAGAKLFVDGTPTTLSGAVRQFHTPALPAGQAFFYELKAEVTIDGKTEVEQKRVVVRAGEMITAEFPRLLTLSQTGAATVASK